MTEGYIVTIGGHDIDYFYDVDDFLKPGDACMCKPAGKQVGGCVLNFASVASMLSSEVRHLDCLKKDDEGTALLLGAMEEYGINSESVVLDPQAVNGSCLILRHGDEKCIYVISPVCQPLKEEEKLQQLLNNASYIYTLPTLAHSLLGGFEMLKKARKAGAKIIFDGGVRYDQPYQYEALYELADGVFMNRMAYQRLCEKSGRDGLATLLNNGCQFVCVTDGANGVTCYRPNGKIHQKALKVNVVDSTGAGDSFAAGFVHCLNKGVEPEDALRFASAVAAYCCTGQGGNYGAVTEEVIFRFLDRMED